jgi:hypothetical protein
MYTVFLLENLKERCLSKVLKHTEEDNIKINFEEIGYDDL